MRGKEKKDRVCQKIYDEGNSFSSRELEKFLDYGKKPLERKRLKRLGERKRTNG